MKLLLDENLPHEVRNELPGHDVFTVAFMKWSGISNGALLRAAADAGFDAVITNDRALQHQQNLDALPIAVVILLAKSNTIESLRLLFDELLEALQTLQPRQLVTVGHQ
jgi:predicted nuclease of predicted toxin-antitoxin system